MTDNVRNWIYALRERGVKPEIIEDIILEGVVVHYRFDDSMYRYVRGIRVNGKTKIRKRNHDILEVYSPGITKSLYSVHKLVVHHKNNDSCDDRYENLELITHAVRHQPFGPCGPIRNQYCRRTLL